VVIRRAGTTILFIHFDRESFRAGLNFFFS